MKGVLVTVLIALALVVVLFSTRSSDKAEPYAEKVVQAIDQASRLQVDSKINALKKALESYYFDNNQYPEDLKELIPTYLRVEDDIKDPWGGEFEIESDDGINVTLISSGKDRIFGNDDDIKRRI